MYYIRIYTHSISTVVLRATEINNCPKIAPDFGPDSRRGKGRIIVLCNPCRNTEAGPKDKQDWMINFYASPKSSGLLPLIVEG
jgi:hypothetical protein